MGTFTCTAHPDLRVLSRASARSALKGRKVLLTPDPLKDSIPLIPKCIGKGMQVQQLPAVTAAPWPHRDVMRDTAVC